MALLFRTELGGGSSIEPYIVNVTCVPSMVGKTVTMTQGSTVLSKICPSSLEVTFKPMNDGLWTVECEGSTKDVTLLAWGTYNVSISWGLSGWLETIGKTTTETNLLVYLNDANNQADIRELMTRHVSADYLYDWYVTIPSVLDDVMSSTYGAKWLGLRDYVCDKFMANETAKATMLNSDNWEYILKDKVPVMTSNTTPYGEVIYGTVLSEKYAYSVFDRTPTEWKANNTNSDHIGYKFVNPTKATMVKYLQNFISDGVPRMPSFTIYATNNGTDRVNFTDWDKLTNSITAETTEGEHYYKFDNDNYYLYYVLVIPKGSGTIGLAELQFYGRSLNVSVPKMTSNTKPWGVVTATDYDKDNYDSYDPWKAFANATDKGWLPANFNDELVYDFGYPVLVKKMTLRNAIQANKKTSKVYYDLFGSIDGQKYDLIQNDVNCYTHRNDLFTYSIDTNEYRFYKLVCTKNDNGRATSGYGCILQFYGVDYSEREFEEGSTIKYLYDHGVELQNIEIVASSSQAEKLPYCLYQHSSTKTDVGFISPLLDMINYKLMRTVFGDIVTTNSYMSVCDTPTGSATAYKYTNIDLPYNHYLDISNITYNGYTRIEIKNTGNAVKVTEWWLE